MLQLAVLLLVFSVGVYAGYCLRNAYKINVSKERKVKGEPKR